VLPHHRHPGENRDDGLILASACVHCFNKR
jgi:hypothetical protein